MSFLATTYSSSHNRRQAGSANQVKQINKNRSQSNKRSSSRVINSFCFNLSSTILKNSRSVSRDRPRKLSLGNSTPSNRRSASINIYGFNNSGKAMSSMKKAEFENSNKILLKNELISSLLIKARTDIKDGNTQSAMRELNKILRTDQSNPKALYMRANCYITLKKHKLAIPDLLSIIQEDPKFDRNVYSALAICFVELEDFNTAIRQLTKCVSIFPNYAEGYVNRGLLYNRLKCWDKAVNDFYEATSLCPTKGNGYIGLADTLIGMKDTKAALSTLEQAFQDISALPSALLKRGKIYLELLDFNKALRDLEKLLTIQNENVEAFYYKAFALIGLNQISDAALCLEQVIKYDVSSKYTGAAIYNLGAIKIKQRDYYGAMFTFKRGVDLGLEIEEQKVLKTYVEAILMLMKRRFKEGVNMLTKIIKNKNELISEYIGNCHAYRGYAYSSLEEHDKAVKDLNAASMLQALDKSSEFNLIMSKAILLAVKDKEEALKLFDKAGHEFPNSIEPKLFTAAVNFGLARSNNKQYLAENSKELLDEAVKLRDSESDVYFFRGIIHYYLGNIKEAIKDIETAIDKAEDNVVDHFLARGACSAKLKMYKEAIQDFCIAIQLNGKCAEAYLFRARCAFAIDETEMAYEDFQKLTILNPEDPNVNIHAGNFLLLTGDTEKALKAYLNASKKKPNFEATLQRAKCYLLMGKLEDTIIEIKKCAKIQANQKLNYDLEVLEIILNSSTKENAKQSFSKTLAHLNNILLYKVEGYICKTVFVHWYKGVFLFFLGDFQKAKSEFKQVVTSTDESDDETMEREHIEIVYNLALIYIASESYESAFTHLNEIVYYLEGKDRGKVLLIIGMLQLALKRQKESRSLITEASKFDPDTVQAYLDKKTDIKILPLSSSSKFASAFPMIKLVIVESSPILVRPCFSLPKVEMPRMELDVEPVILNKFTVKSVKSKPETPWLNRVKGSIQFTDEIQNIDNESRPESKEPDIKIEEYEDFCSDATMRKYKSESVSLEENSLNQRITSEDSMDPEFEDIENIEFY